jgi:hypothetical protein
MLKALGRDELACSAGVVSFMPAAGAFVHLRL